jgi:hypothetical protein
MNVFSNIYMCVCFVAGGLFSKQVWRKRWTVLADNVLYLMKEPLDRNLSLLMFLFSLIIHLVVVSTTLGYSIARCIGNGWRCCRS